MGHCGVNSAGFKRDAVEISENISCVLCVYKKVCTFPIDTIKRNERQSLQESMFNL